MTEKNKLEDLAKNIKSWGETLGFQQVAISKPDLDQASQRLMDWLGQGYQGSMQWMAEHGEKRYRVEKLVEDTVRVISVRMDYLNDSNMIAVLRDSNKAYISRYALGRDYHKLIRKRLAELGKKIEAEIDRLGLSHLQLIEQANNSRSQQPAESQRGNHRKNATQGEVLDHRERAVELT